jgi:hypothetical protein
MKDGTINMNELASQPHLMDYVGRGRQSDPKPFEQQLRSSGSRSNSKPKSHHIQPATINSRKNLGKSDNPTSSIIEEEDEDNIGVDKGSTMGRRTDAKGSGGKYNQNKRSPYKSPNKESNTSILNKSKDESLNKSHQSIKDSKDGSKKSGPSKGKDYSGSFDGRDKAK